MKCLSAKFVAALCYSFLVAGCASSFVADCTSSQDGLHYLKLGDSRDFDVNLDQKCNPSRIVLHAGNQYTFQVQQLSPVSDGRIKCKSGNYKSEIGCNEPIGPDGFSTGNLPFFIRLVMSWGEQARPLPEGKWLELVGTVGQSDKHFFPVMQYLSQDGKETPSAKYTPTNTGELFVLANDYPRGGRYKNNEGAYRLTVTCVGVKAKKSP